MAKGQATILVVDDEASIRRTLKLMLSKEGYTVVEAEEIDSAMQMLNIQKVDLVLTDMRLEENESATSSRGNPERSGVALLRRVKEFDPSIEVIVITAYAKAEDAVEAMKLGAYDYVIKPFNNEELRVQVGRALERRNLGAEVQRLKRELHAKDGPEHLVAESKAMQEVLDLVERLARVDSTVLITGESGVGKEVVARLIHKRGDRPGTFVAVNCGALPENLVESELFGYEKGAFTGADQARAGLIEQARQGTIFLDEIGELPAAAQVKLLRALEGGSIRRLGSHEERPVDTRFIAATNRDLEEDVRRGTFREDLFYRLNVMRVQIPPLRERPEDLRELVRQFAARAAARLGVPLEGVEPEVVDILEQYPFPGNVRELANLIERAVILAKDHRITPATLPAELTGGQESTPIPAVPERIPEEFDIESYLERIEMMLFRKALAEAEGVKSHAAELLGLSFRQFRYKAKKYGL